MKFWCRYLNQKLSSKRVCYENIKHGPRGLRGATGATGATGPKGDRGPSGENLVVKSTKTLPPEKEANVKSTHIENTTYLEFEIPRGYNGVPEKILAGKTNTIEPNNVAKVEDRYEGDVHFLDFYIPRGKTGEKGETGAQGIQGVQGNKGEPGEKGEPGKDGRSETIIIDKTHTVEPSENANVQDNFENNTHFLTFYIPKGEKGEKGERGEKGDEIIMAGTTTLVGENEPAKVEDRYENDVHFLDFQIPKGKTGEKGETGAQGIQGVQGNKGEPGEKGETGVGEKIVVDATQTINPNENAVVEDNFDGTTHHLTFSIPKGEKGEKGETGPRGLPGEIGRSEGISIDLTETINPEEDAQVLDNFENYIHHLSFYIPKGEKGEKGERGEKGDEIIMAGTTTLIGENEPAKVEDRYENDVHFLDFQIPKGKTGEKGDPGEKGPQGDRGPQGVKGEQGVAGPPGTTNNINATIYEENSQEIANGRPLTFGTTLTNNGMSINNASITIQYTGTYIVSFSINNGSSATAGDCVGIYSNNTLVGGTKRPLTTSTNVSCTIVLRLKANDVITLVPTLSSNRTLTSSGAPSAMLTVVQIA